MSLLGKNAQREKEKMLAIELRMEKWVGVKILRVDRKRRTMETEEG